MTYVHVTTSEAALAGVLITGAAGWLATLSAQRSGRARDHLTRIWEQRAATYESLLTFAAQRDERRNELMRRIDEIGNIKPGIQSDEDLIRQRAIRVRLAMYGDHEVRIAFIAWRKADDFWTHEYRGMFRGSADDSNLEGRVQARLRTKSANEAVAATLDRLVVAVARAVQTEPKRAER